MRCSRRVVTNPHQRRQARWFETFGCGTPRSCASSPTERSPSDTSSTIRSRVRSPSTRKYLAIRSDSPGATGNRKGALRIAACMPGIIHLIWLIWLLADLNPDGQRADEIRAPTSLKARGAPSPPLPSKRRRPIRARLTRVDHVVDTHSEGQRLGSYWFAGDGLR